MKDRHPLFVTQPGAINKSDPTWRNLRELLRGEGRIDGVHCQLTRSIPLSNCFFTNFFMGLRPPKIQAKGRFKAAADDSPKQFRADCYRVFLATVQLQRPAVIFLLGSVVPAMLAEHHQDLNG